MTPEFSPLTRLGLQQHVTEQGEAEGVAMPLADDSVVEISGRVQSQNLQQRIRLE